MTLPKRPPDPLPIAEIVGKLGLEGTEVEPFGSFSGKLSLDLHRRLVHRPVGRYVGVTAINPTPFGEGKTVVSIGLAMALAARGHRSIVTLREPSLALFLESKVEVQVVGSRDYSLLMKSICTSRVISMRLPPPTIYWRR